MSNLVEAPSDPEPSGRNDLVAAIHGMVEAQSKDTEVRRKELEVRSEEIASTERIALKSIDAQERSLIDNRKQYNKHLIHKYFYIGGISVVIGGFALAMVHFGAKDVIIEALKLALAFGGGAFGGYHAGKNKKDPEED